MRQRLSLLWILLVCATCAGQQAMSNETSGVASYAGLIFTGRVVAVAVEPARSPGEVSSLRVTFFVDDAVRGVSPGQTVTIRQWNSAADEYRIGESLVLFLYAPSGALGLTSPVGGRVGHRRPDEIPAQILESLREPAVSETPVTIRPRIIPRRPPKKVPARLEREREVAQ